MNRKKIEGAALLALAALFFWLPSYVSEPGPMDRKILVATDRVEGFFRNTVVLIAYHNRVEAFGFALNKPGDVPGGPSSGGPVEEDSTYVLHSLDISAPGTEEIEGLAIGYTKDEDFLKRGKPGQYIVLKGYAGWRFGQLEEEAEEGAWKVIDYDPALVFRTDPAMMHEEAMKRARR